MPAKDDDGRLTEFTGADQFKLGVAVKKGDATYMLRAFDWSVPWAMKVDKNLNGAGKAVQSTEVQDLLRDGPDTSLGEKDWSLRPGSGDVFEGFSTQAEAMKRSPKELLNWIHKAQAVRPDLLPEHLRRARRQGPGRHRRRSTATPRTSNFGKDMLSASVLRDGELVRSRGRHQAQQRREHARCRSAGPRRSGRPRTSRSGTVLKVELYVTENNWEVGHGFMSPFNGSSPQLTPGDGQATRSSRLAARRLVEPAQDVHRLGAQRAVLRAPVRLGELAGAVVELGVADLAVLRVARRLELRALRAPPRASRGAAPAQRRADDEHDQRQRRRGSSSEVHVRLAGSAGCALRARRAPRRRPAPRLRAPRGCGHSAIRPPSDRDQRADPDPRDHRRDDQPERRGRRVVRVGAGEAARAPGRGTRRAAPASASRREKTLSPSSMPRAQRADVGRDRGPHVAPPAGLEADLAGRLALEEARDRAQERRRRREVAT